MKMPLLGLVLSWGMVAISTGSPSHVGSPDPALEEEIEEQLGAPEGISLPEVQVIRFLGQHFPEMLEELEGAKGEEERAEALSRARGIILEWEGHFRMGEEVAKNFIDLERLHFVNDGLVAKYVKMEEGPDKVAASDELRKNITKIHDLRMAMEQAELKRLKEEIVAIEENLKDSAENRSAMIENELRDLLEFWRLEQLGLTADRDRERPAFPAEPLVEPVPAVPIAPEGEGTAPAPERVEPAVPVESEGGGFIGRAKDPEGDPREKGEE